jgi:hypothetical protein
MSIISKQTRVYTRKVLFNNMEGYLSIWINYVHGWKKRYFRLIDQKLHYCSERGQTEIGIITLKTAKIIHRSKKPKRICIDTGFTRMHLKANTDEDGRTWAAALTRAKQSGPVEVPTRSTESSSEVNTERESKIELLQSKLEDIWSLQLQLISNLDNIPEEIKLNPVYGNISSISHDLKYSIADAINLIEEQASYFDRILRSKLGNKKEQIMNEPDSPSEMSEEAFFDPEPEDVQNSDHPVEMIPIHPQELLSRVVIPVKQEEPYRRSLPVLRNPNEKIKIWQIIKNSIGKELYRIAVPVYFNEPLSFLQKFTEDLAYNELILNANLCPDSCMRMAYIACFAISSYTSTVNRHLKPFNPLLGETFELQRFGFRCISEQVSHHPPISALHCEHKDYRFWATTEVKSSFRGTYLQINPVGAHHIFLKRHSEEYIWRKATTRVNSIIIGSINLEHSGIIDIFNQQTGDRATVNFKERGWFAKSSDEVSGVIYDKHGLERFSIQGKWSEGMSIKNLRTGEVIQGFERYPPPEGYELSYYFTEFALQLNLPPENFPGLPHTDSRFRPDQRALENGDIDFAAGEKARLEEKQRRCRKFMELEGVIFRPRWFEKSEDEWVYKGGYFESRDSGFYEDIPNIY